MKRETEAGMLFVQKRYAEALLLDARLLPVAEARLGPDDLQTTRVLNQMAVAQVGGRLRA